MLLAYWGDLGGSLVGAVVGGLVGTVIWLAERSVRRFWRGLRTLRKSPGSPSEEKAPVE